MTGVKARQGESSGGRWLHLRPMKNIVILISGRGSNMEAMVKACAAEGWPARIAAVISNRPDAAGLQFAAAQGVATAVVDHKAFPDRESFDAELDHGPMVAQAVVPVLDGDDAAALAARVLKLEHRMYPAAVRWFVSGQLAVEGARVRQLAGESQSFS